MQEFLEKEGVTGKLKKGLLPPKNSSEAWGNNLWEYLKKVADEQPAWGGKILAMPLHSDHLNAAGDGGKGSGFDDAAVAHRLGKFSGPRGKMYYDTKLQDAKLLFFPAGGNHRLLQHHYAFNFFAEPKLQSFYKRFIRDFMRYQDEIQCAGHEMVARVRADALAHQAVAAQARRGAGFDSNNGTHAAAAKDGRPPYYAIHVRRGDFQFKDVKISAGATVKWS